MNSVCWICNDSIFIKDHWSCIKCDNYICKDCVLQSSFCIGCYRYICCFHTKKYEKCVTCRKIKCNTTDIGGMGEKGEKVCGCVNYV